MSMSKHLTIGFYLYDLTYRGTNTALFNYAYYNQKLLKNTSIILLHKDDNIENKQKIVGTLEKTPENTIYCTINEMKKVYSLFKSNFNLIEFENEKSLDQLKLNAIYVIKHGREDVSKFKFNNEAK